MASKGKKKASLLDLSKSDLNSGREAIEAHLVELFQHGDRACALVAAASLDMSLKRLLSASFVPLSPEEENSIFFGPHAVLSGLSNKIAIAGAIGLILDEEQHDLTKIRQIRNAFAHAVNPMSFTDEPVHKECKTLAMFDTGYAIKKEECSPRDFFISSTMHLYLTLGSRANEYVSKQNRLLREALKDLKGNGSR